MKPVSLITDSLKGVLLVLAVIVLTTSITSAQTGERFSNQKSGAAAAVRKTLDELYAALGRNDAATLDRIYANDYTLINESGELTTKAQRLAAIRSGELKYESISFADAAIRVYGDTAVATYRATVKATSKGKDVGGQVLVTTTFLKMDGRWQLLAAQATSVNE